MRDCVPAAHLHVDRCRQAGYANGRDDALDEVEEAIQRLVDEIEDTETLPAYRMGLKDCLAKVKDAR